MQKVQFRGILAVMEPIKPKIWIIWALILFGVGFAADYYFLHFLFHEKRAATVVESEGQSDLKPEVVTTPNEVPVLAGAPKASAEKKSKDNFFENLQKCAPEIAAQAVGTPEALLIYLKQSVGFSREESVYENYHMTLADGSERRIHLAPKAENSKEKEMRFFKLDSQGIPEALPLKSGENLQSLMALGRVHTHEVKRQIALKDKSTLSLEEHNEQIYEFQLNNHGKVLSCHIHQCECL